MSPHLPELSIRRMTGILRLLLLTLLVFMAWVFHASSGVESLLEGQPVLLVQVSRSDFILVLVLLLLNVAATHKVFRQFRISKQGTRFTSGLLIISLLTLIVWICKLFLLQTVSDLQAHSLMNAGIGRSELTMAVLLVCCTLLGGMLLLRRFQKVEPLVVISAYSKKVQCRGEWISIEQYLTQELGVVVSHGITPEEKDRALEEFAREQAAARQQQAAAPQI